MRGILLTVAAIALALFVVGWIIGLVFKVIVWALLLAIVVGVAAFLFGDKEDDGTIDYNNQNYRS